MTKKIICFISMVVFLSNANAGANIVYEKVLKFTDEDNSNSKLSIDGQVVPNGIEFDAKQGMGIHITMTTNTNDICPGDKPNGQIVLKVLNKHTSSEFIQHNTETDSFTETSVEGNKLIRVLKGSATSTGTYKVEIETCHDLLFDLKIQAN